jgi:hypothetical protein
MPGMQADASGYRGIGEAALLPGEAIRVPLSEKEIRK